LQIATMLREMVGKTLEFGSSARSQTADQHDKVRGSFVGHRKGKISKVRT